MEDEGFCLGYVAESESHLFVPYLVLTYLLLLNVKDSSSCSMVKCIQFILGILLTYFMFHIPLVVHLGCRIHTCCTWFAEEMVEDSHKKFGFIDTGGNFCIFSMFKGEEWSKVFKMLCEMDAFLIGRVDVAGSGFFFSLFSGIFYGGGEEHCFRLWFDFLVTDRHH